MTPGRGDRAAPPRPENGYDLRFVDRTAAEGWEQLCKQMEGNMRVAYHLLADGPHPAEVTPRHHQLKGRLATETHTGRELPQWQYEVGGAARIWYIVDRDKQTVWITKATSAHPAATDRGKTFR